MALIKAPFAFANSVDTMTGTPPVAVPGINFTTTTANADGTAVTVLSALAFDVHYLIIGFSGTSASGTDYSTLADVLIDPAGGTSWTNFIDDLCAGFQSIMMTGTNGWSCWYHFPIFIKAGSSIGMRARTNAANLNTGQVAAYAYGNPSRPDQWWCGSKVETIGVVPTTSKGTNVLPGDSGTYGSWTDIGTVTTSRWGAYQLGIAGSDSAPASGVTFWQLGTGSLQIPGTQTIARGISSTGGGCTVQPGISWCDIPEGETLQLRATYDTTGAEVITAAIYGVY